MARSLFFVVVALVVGLVGGEVASPREGKTGHGTQNHPSLSGPCFSSPTGLWCGSDCPARCELEVEYRADAIRVLDAYMSFEDKREATAFWLSIGADNMNKRDN